MRVYKGFNKKIQAKHGKGTFQYEKGKTYKEEKSKTRSTGFHAAEYILDCLQWYPIDGKNKFFLCEAGGSIDEEDGCSMVVSTELTLIRELTLMEIAMAAMGEKRKRCIRRKREVKSDRRDKDSDRKGKTSGSERRIRNRDRTDRRGRERQASGSRCEEC